jgi:hypothetical protein
MLALQGEARSGRDHHEHVRQRSDGHQSGGPQQGCAGG